MSKLENSFKQIFKRKVNFTTSVLISFLISGNIGYAEINEKPQEGKKYDDYLIYNSELQIFENTSSGNNLEYFFNKGIKIEAETGRTNRAIYVGAGSEFVNATFNIGKAEGKDYDLYLEGIEESLKVGKRSTATINASGGNLYFGSSSWDNSGGAATIYLDEESKFTVTANSFYTTGGAETNLKLFDNATASINLTGNFISAKGGTGIAIENSNSGSNTNLTLKANNIFLSTIEGGAKRLAGLYLLGYNDGGNSTITVNLTAQDTINISGFSRGITTFGSADITLKANDIQIHADESAGRGLNLAGYDAAKSTTLTMNANSINISGTGYGIYAHDRVNTDITADNIVITSNSWSIASMKNSKINLNGKVSNISKSLFSSEKGEININTLENHIVSNGIAAKVTTEGEVNINKNNTTYSNTIEGGLWAETDGIINVNLNGKASYLTGYTWLGDSYNGFVNLGLSNNALWNNTEDSAISKFKLNSGIVDMSYKEEHQLIEIKNLSGNNGTFIMDISGDDINQENSKTDFLKIENADQSQKHFIKIGSSSINGLNNYDFDNKNPDNAIWIADANTNIIFEGEKFESIENIYNYTPELDINLRPTTNNSNNENNWYITGITKKENEVTETIEDDMTLYYMDAAMARIEMDTLHKRLGDIRNYKEEEGTWARVLSGQMEYDKSGYLKNNYTMVQAGYDKSRASKNGIWFTGFGIHHRKGKTDFRNGDGENRTLGISVYKSWSGYEGQYFDIIGKYSHIDNEYKSFNKINEKMEADYNTWSGSLSIEYGKKKWSDNKKWYIQPNTQLNYTYVNGQNYKTSSGVRAEQKNINSLIGKAGIYAGHKSNHFIKAAVLHEFMGDYGVDIKGKDAELRKRADGKDSWFEIGIGGDFKVGKTDSMNIYYEIERTYGSDFETNWQVSIGMRYRFNKLSDLLPVSNSKPKYNSNIKYSLNGKNHFTFDNSNLTEDGKKVIRIISEEINKNNKKGKLTIEGHTDSIGTAEYNQKLSEKRAKSVEKEFKENLKTEINYETKGYGKNKPTADNSTPEGRAKNRRVDIKFE